MANILRTLATSLTVLSITGIMSPATDTSKFSIAKTENGIEYTSPSGLPYSSKIINGEKFIKSTRTENGNTLKVNIIPSSSGGTFEVHPAFAFNIDNPRIADMGFYNEDMGGYIFYDLPEGNYNIFALLVKQSENNLDTTEMLAIQSLDVPRFGEISISMDDCIYETKWEPMLPDGNKFIHCVVPEGGNTGVIKNALMYFYNDIEFIAFSMDMVVSDYVIRSNLENTNFSAINHSVYMGDYGIAVLQAEINFTNQTISTTEDRWKSCEPVTFMQTPLNKKWLQILEEEGEDECWDSSYGIFFVPGSFNRFYTANLSLPGPEGKIMMWKQPELTNVSAFQQPISNSIGASERAAVAGQFLKYTDDGLIPVGHNLAYGLDYVFIDGERTAENFETGNPRYSGLQYTNIIYGNCSPILVLAPFKIEDATGFNFGYVGNYGENMNIDSFDIENNWGPEALEFLGGPVCDYTLSLNGQQVCATYGDAASYSWTTGNYEAHIGTHNVNIDNELTGYNKAVVKFTADVTPGELPTLTALQFRDENDNITNRYENPTGAFAEMFAGCFQLVMNANYDEYYDYSSIESIKFEYAPTGNEDWSELEVTQHHDLFWPTYGECYRTDLSDINRSSESGWYDVRITVTSYDGASEEQIISPAFKVESISAVDNILNNYDEIYVDGRNIITSQDAEIYTIDGKKVGNINLVTGIYIVKSGKRTVKIQIK